MSFILVLQWPCSEISDFDKMTDFEELLERTLPRKLGEVDGHDAGSNEMNIFIFTDRPEKAFAECRALADKSGFATGLQAAFRDANVDTYTRLWPEGFPEPFVVK